MVPRLDELSEEPAKMLGVVWLLRRTALLAVVPSVVVALYSRDVDRHCECDHLARALPAGVAEAGRSPPRSSCTASGTGAASRCPGLLDG